MMQGIFKLNVIHAIPLPSIFETVVVDGIEDQKEIKQYDWIPALRAAALNLQAINQYAGTTAFPRAISCNPDAMVWIAETTNTDTKEVVPAHWEGHIGGFLGAFNTPPTADRGMVTVNIEEYDWLESDLFPPGALSELALIVGLPPVGKILE